MAVAAGSTVAAVENEPDDAPEPGPVPTEAAGGLDIERIAALWPAVADAVREENGMVAALLAEAVPTQLEGGRLTVQFPADAAFSKKKAEANRDLVTGALRSLGGHAVAVVFELGVEREQAGPVTLTADELAERLMRDFDAEEIFEDHHPETEDR
jgi:hypothetical protein